MKDQLELVHGYLRGPITPATPSGKRYFLLLVDDLMRYMWLALLATKDEATTAIIRLWNGVESKSGCKLWTLRMDHGGEFTFGSFTTYCAELGLEHHLTAPYSPQQNSVIERRNQMIVGNLLKAKRVPGEFWGEAVPTPVFILHRLPAKSRKPDVHFMRTFSCVVHVRETRPS
jgi:hypothetical protein